MQIRELYSHYRENYPDRTALIAAVSRDQRAAWAGQAASGPPPFAAKFQILRRYAQVRKSDGPEARLQLEQSAYRRSGGFLLLLGLSYLNVCLCMFLTGEATAYQGYIVYLVALVAFIKLGLAIWGNVAARKLHSPILSSLKILLHCLHSGHSIYPALHETAVSLALQSSSLFGMARRILFMLRKKRS